MNDSDQFGKTKAKPVGYLRRAQLKSWWLDLTYNSHKTTHLISSSGSRQRLPAFFSGTCRQMKTIKAWETEGKKSAAGDTAVSSPSSFASVHISGNITHVKNRTQDPDRKLVPRPSEADSPEGFSGGYVWSPQRND
jgi:hypothetical protein